MKSVDEIIKQSMIPSMRKQEEESPPKSRDMTSRPKPDQFSDSPRKPRKGQFNSQAYGKSKGKFLQVPQTIVYGGALRGMKGSTVKVLIALLSHVNNRSKTAFPGTTRLAFLAGVSSRDVTEALVVFRALGVEIMKHRQNSYSYRSFELRAIASMESDPRPSVSSLRRQILQLVEDLKGRASFQNEIRRIVKTKQPPLSR